MLEPAKTLSDLEVVSAVQQGRSVSEVLRLLKRAKVGSNYRVVREVIQRLQINTAHWLEHRQTKLPDPSEIFVVNGRHSRNTLQRILLRDGLIHHHCAICGAEPFWRGKPLVLRLDHQNGTRDDDRLENLRFLCPNCDAQTDTFCGRNKPKGKESRQRCLDCPALTTGARCRSCSSKYRHKLNPQPTKIVWPPLPQIHEALRTSNVLAVAKTLGVSDNALRKHLRRNLEKLVAQEDTIHSRSTSDPK